MPLLHFDWSRIFNSYHSCLQLNYRHDYVTNVMGKNTAPAVTVDTERARQANYIQSEVWRLLAIHKNIYLSLHWWMLQPHPFFLFRTSTKRPIRSVCLPDTLCLMTLHSTNRPKPTASSPAMYNEHLNSQNKNESNAMIAHNMISHLMF